MCEAHTDIRVLYGRKGVYKVSTFSSAIRDVVGDEASAHDSQAERELGGPVGHHRLQLAPKTSEGGRIPST